MKNFRIMCAMTLLALSLSIRLCLAQGEVGIMLASTKVEPCPVVIMTPGGQMERSAGSALATYLQKITGQTFRVTASSDPIPERAILVGPIDEAAPKDLGDEGFIIKTVGNRLQIVGGGERGTMYGVYWFLEYYCGCKWWSYNEEDVPRLSTLKIPALDVRQKPAFALHDLMNREGQSGQDNFVYKIHANSGIQFTGGHTLNSLLNAEAEKKPEFWPMDEKGQRKANGLHFNYLAPGIAEALATSLGKEVEKRDKDVQHYFYQAGMGDWYGGMDMSPASQKLYDDETWTDEDGVKKPGYSASLLQMVNKSADILANQYPGAKVSTFAYMSLEAPPAKTRPAANVYIWIPRLRHDTVLSIEESQQNLSFRRNLEQWLKIAPGRVYIWDYGVNFTNFMAAFPCLHSIAANIKYYHRVGVAGVMVQGNYVSTGGDLEVLKNYVWSKLLWNPDLDVDTLIHTFCTGYYGGASEEMLQYVNTLEDSVRRPKLIHASEFDNPSVYLTPELVARLRALLGKALAKTKGIDDDPFYRRVREAGVDLDALELWTEGPLHERGNQLIRTNIDKEHGGEYTFDRAKEMTKYSRGASPVEWGTALYYQRAFLTMQGGPLYALRNGKLTVKVAPYNPRRIWDVLFDGKTAIDGIRENFDPRVTYFEPAGSPADSKVELDGEAGIEAWSPEVKQAAHESVEVVDDHTFRITGALKRAMKGYETNKMSVETDYLVGDNPASVMVEVKVGDQWQKLDVGVATQKKELPQTTMLRITRADRGLTITDNYGIAQVEGGAVVYEPKAGIVKTVVRLAPVAVADTEAPYFTRDIQIHPFP